MSEKKTRTRTRSRRRRKPKLLPDPVLTEKGRVLGQPTKLTEKRLAMIEAACKTGGGLKHIAALVGVSQPTLENWRAKLPDLKLAMDRWRAEGLENGAIRKLHELIHDDHWPAIKYQLDRISDDWKPSFSDGLGGDGGELDDSEVDLSYL